LESKPAIIELEHVYSHSPAAVWRALTDPELVARCSKTAFEGMGKEWPKKLGDLAHLIALIAA
jgi:hypothetical protein